MHANEIHPDSCSLYWTSSVLPSPNPHLNASNFDKLWSSYCNWTKNCVPSHFVILVAICNKCTVALSNPCRMIVKSRVNFCNKKAISICNNCSSHFVINLFWNRNLTWLTILLVTAIAKCQRAKILPISALLKFVQKSHELRSSRECLGPVYKEGG